MIFAHPTGVYLAGALHDTPAALRHKRPDQQIAPVCRWVHFVGVCRGTGSIENLHRIKKRQSAICCDATHHVGIYSVIFIVRPNRPARGDKENNRGGCAVRTNLIQSAVIFGFKIFRR